MNPNTKLFKMLKYLLDNKDRAVSSHELSEKTGIEHKQITPFYNRLIKRADKKSINGINHFLLKKSEVDYVRKIIERSQNEAEVD